MERVEENDHIFIPILNKTTVQTHFLIMNWVLVRSATAYIAHLKIYYLPGDNN